MLKNDFINNNNKKPIFIKTDKKKTTFFFHSSKKSEQCKGKIKIKHKICVVCFVSITRAHTVRTQFVLQFMLHFSEIPFINW